MGGEGNHIQLKLLIVLCLTTFKGALTKTCHIDKFSQLPSTTGCYRPVDTSTPCENRHYSCSTEKDAITWSILNLTSGRVDVSFVLPLPPSCHRTQYEVELKVSDEPHLNNQQNCAKAKKTDFRSTHTKQRKYVIDDECLNADSCPPMCNENGVVSFQFVFTGCYQVVIHPQFGTDSQQPIDSCPKYIQTNYSKSLLTETVPMFKPSYQDQRRNSPVTITYAPLTCNHLELVIKLIANVSYNATGEANCHSTGRIHSLCPLGPKRSPNCDNSSTEITASIPDCTFDEDRVACVFGNISPGTYCIKMEVEDDRCAVGTLWTEGVNGSNPCIWQTVYQALASPASNSTVIEPQVDTTRSYITMGGILFTVTILSAVAVCFSFKMFAKRRRSRVDLDSLECPTPVEPSRILLLYARDCQPFMGLMTTFRQLLEDETSCEVYDCFDDSRWAELSRNPIEWMRRLVAQDDTKIIVVATKCSSLRHQALLDNNIVRYNEPTSNDDLFLNALQALTDSNKDVYKRIFVVRFDGISEDTDLFAHLNAYTRFVLPLHVDKLICSLNESVFSDQSVRMKESEVQSLSQDLTHLTTYMKENDSYLQNILTIYRST